MKSSDKHITSEVNVGTGSKIKRAFQGDAELLDVKKSNEAEESAIFREIKKVFSQD